MAKRRIVFTFGTEVAAEPIIYNLGLHFRLVTNIRRANMTEDGGWIEVELEGEDDDIAAGIDWATSRGVRVDPATGG